MAAYAGVLPTYTIGGGILAGNNFEYVTGAWAQTAPFADGWNSVPAVTGGSDLFFVYNGPHDISNTSVIIMPPSLLQATGTAGPPTVTWELDADFQDYLSSSLTLVNQGQIFVNDSNSLVASVGIDQLDLHRRHLARLSGIQTLQNDGTINVVGTTGIGTTTATFSVGDTNLTVTGSGRINVYGNANVVFEQGVGVEQQPDHQFRHRRRRYERNGHGGRRHRPARQMVGFWPATR